MKGVCGNMEKITNITIDIGDIRVRVLLDRGFFNLIEKRSSPPHSHSDFEMHFVFEDHVWFETSDGRILVETNDICIFPRGFLHRPLAEESECQRTSLRFGLKKLNSAKTNHAYADIILAKLENLQFMRNLPSFAADLRSIISETYAHRTFSHERIKAMFTLFFSSLFSLLISSSTDGDQAKLSIDNAESDIRIAIIEEFFTYNYMNDITLSDLAAHLHLSEKQTQRMIQRAFNATFKEQLSRHRMHVAKILLLNTNDPVKDIALKVGYKSYGGFYNLFSNEMGISPMDYRNQKGHV